MTDGASLPNDPRATALALDCLCLFYMKEKKNGENLILSLY